MKKVPIGISDFKKVKSGNYYYVDKTMLIKDVFESGDVVLIARPRRFGKTLNLSMLRYYLTLDGNHKDLFVDTQIWKHTSYRDLQGQFPVIFITFKNITQPTYESMLKKIEYTIAAEFKKFRYLLAGDVLEDDEKEMFNNIINRRALVDDLGSSLEFLVELLYKYHQKEVIILLDEYDVPLQTAYMNGMYDEVKPIMRELLTGAFKDQEMLEKGVITGNLTLAQAGIFTGLNNLDVFNVTDNEMADKFGFTSCEAQELLDYYHCKNTQEIQDWYDGYTFGEAKGIFNPWSMLKCIAKKGKCKMYWVNTSDNFLLKKLIGSASEATKKDIETLLTGKSVRHTIEEAIVFKDLDTRFELIWSLLLFTGYLTYTSCDLSSQGTNECDLRIPNTEVALLYKSLITQIFIEAIPGQDAKKFLAALTEGETEEFSRLLQGFVLNNMSTFDLPDTEPERSYHLFILGLLAILIDQYEVTSNRESGLGRYDIMLIPKVARRPGIIIEFKRGNDSDLEVAAQRALDQIVEKKYAAPLISKNISPIIAYGIGFKGKSLYVKSLSLSKNAYARTTPNQKLRIFPES